ncbi:MAG: carboxypeptidase-like regulatory domain-containing protein, partial [Planctomycetaceae bacterium]|nr:carboxypeptidase-like regulatory domain-containing protein [Planctomycetaceae bacterium]
VEVKLRSRPQTEEELNKRWNYIVTGTVRDTEGKPLDGATITVRRSGIMERGLYRAGYRKTKSDVTGRFTLRFNPNDLDAVNSLEKKSNATPEKPDVYGFRIEAKRAGFVWGGIRLDDGKIVANQFLDDNNQRIDHYDMVGMEPKPSDLSNVKSQFKMTPDNVFYALEPKNIEMVMQPAVEIFGAIKFDPQPDGTPKEPDKKAGLFYKKSYISLIFDMPVKDGKNNEQLPEFWDESEYPDYSFNIDALPKEVSAFLRAAQISVPESWKNDQVLIETDSFQLPPAGKYETELRWQTIEKHGTKIHKLNIDSLTDSTGQKFDLQFVKKNEPNEILFNRWSFTGILRDDIGNPIDDAEVRLYRYNRRVGSNFETLKTDAEGKFTTSEIKPYLLTKKDYDRDLLHGEFLAVQFNKDGFLQKEQVIDDDAQLIFLSDIENPHEKTFFNGTLSTERIVEARKSTEFNFVLPRCPIIEGVLVDSDDKPLTGYKLILSADAEFESDFRPYIQTDREGHFVVNKILPKLPFWFQLLDDHNEQDIFRTNNIVFESGKKYEVKLRLRKEPDNSRRLILESVRNSIGVDITAEIVTEDLRTRPLLGKEETKKGREILQKTEKAVRPMLLIEEREIESIEYSFHLGDKVTEYNAKPYHHDYNYLNKPSNLTLGISFESPLNWIFEATQKIHFRNINIDENEIRILTTLQGWYTFGNGISETWNGYVHAGFDGAEFILDTKTSLPKRIITSRSQTEYFDWTPFGNPQNGQFVPKRILCKTGGMTFDFRFKILDQTVWFFDRSVLSDENGEKTICHIENIRINPIKWASEEDESRVRDVLRKYNDANRYWLTLYPKDLPKFGYTFHRRGADDEVLSYETIKAATNWYAEFYRKGISYIGVSRLLVIDIDALRCTRVVENTDAGTLEFDFVLKHAWMNAFGNGIANTWLGWSNSVINRGTAIFDTKTNTVKEIRTETYDERFFDYYELKPGQFVPRRIVIDFSKGKGSNADLMFYDFRFKIYEPCLWLFDRSVEPDKKDFPVWIDNVIVEGKPGTERK